MSWDEDSLHRWLLRAPRPTQLEGSTGHDAAVLQRPGGREVACVDSCIEGVHFVASTSPRKVGRKAANRALSDLAATGAAARAVLLALTAPAQFEESWLRGAIEGVRAAALSAGAALVGGDLSCTARGPAVLSVTALGTLSGRRKPPGRDRARAGQQLVLSGPVGGSGRGRHLDFEPRLEVGRELFQAGATAMMDISDGLAWDLWRLARSSAVRLELERVPLQRAAHLAARQSGRSALDHGLHDGEDHELVATLPAKAQLPAGCVRIGRVVAGSGLGLSAELVRALEGGRAARDWVPGEGGWRHGS